MGVLLKLRVVGPFRAYDADGNDVTPRSQKACAILAIVALSHNRSRSREILQDLLWPDSDPTRGGHSMRRALSDLRQALESCARAIDLGSRKSVSLNEGLFEVDIDDEDRIQQIAWEATPPLLLEDLAISSTTFQEWLREQRMAFEDRLEELDANPRPGRVPGAEEDARPESTVSGHGGAPWESAGTGVTGAAPATGSGSIPLCGTTAAPPWVRIDTCGADEDSTTRFLSKLLGGVVERGLKDGGGVSVCRERAHGPGVEVAVEAHRIGGNVMVLIELIDGQSGLRIFTAEETVPAGASMSGDLSLIRALCNRTVHTAARHLQSAIRQGEQTSAQARAAEAVEQMFSLAPDGLERADALLSDAWTMTEDPAFLAWRGYLRTFTLGERKGVDRAATVDQADAFVRKACQKAPENALVLALASYVQCFALRNYPYGHLLAEQSLKASPDNVLGLAFLGRAKSYLKDHEGGFRLTSRALEVAPLAPYRYTLHFLCGITGLLSGQYSDALHHAEIARGMAPGYLAPQRYVVPLLLQLERRDEARDAFRRLKQIDPGFSLDAMRQDGYPSTGLRDAGLLKFRDSDLDA